MCCLGPGEALQVDGELGVLREPTVLLQPCAQASQTVTNSSQVKLPLSKVGPCSHGPVAVPSHSHQAA